MGPARGTALFKVNWPPSGSRDFQGLKDWWPQPHLLGISTNLACLGEGRAHPSQSILNCTSGPGSPALTPVPLLCSMGFPASRLQDSGLLITRNSTSHHPFHFWFCQHCSLPHASYPASIYFSSSIPIPCPVSLPVPRPLMLLDPKPQGLQISGPAFQKSTNLWPMALGFLLGYFPPLSWNEQAPFLLL